VELVFVKAAALASLGAAELTVCKFCGPPSSGAPLIEGCGEKLFRRPSRRRLALRPRLEEEPMAHTAVQPYLAMMREAARIASCARLLMAREFGGPE